MTALCIITAGFGVLLAITVFSVLGIDLILRITDAKHIPLAVILEDMIIRRFKK